MAKNQALKFDSQFSYIIREQDKQKASENKARTFGKAYVDPWTRILGDAKISENCQILGAWIEGNAKICGNAFVHGSHTFVSGNAIVDGNAKLTGSGYEEYIKIEGNAHISGDAHIIRGPYGGNVKILGGKWDKDIELNEGTWIAPGVRAE